MKTLLVIAFCCLNSIAIAQSPKQSLKSTEILPDDQVAFRIHAPAAQKVTLHTDITKKRIEFKMDNDGVWEGIYSNVPPGAYRYRFNVDGVLTFDPQKSSATEANSIFMMTSGDDFFAMKESVPHGAITERHYMSTTLKRMRRLHIWTPAGFEKSNERLPVLYLIHGGGDQDDAWPTIGCAGNILDNLLAAGKIDPMMVVMPNGTIETGQLLDRVPIFTNHLMTGIIPFVESNYNVHTDSENRAIMGLSMGGLETLEVALFHYQKFDYIFALSSGWWISDVWAKNKPERKHDSKEKRAARLKDIALDFNRNVKLMYFTQGGPEDIAYENRRRRRNDEVV